MTALTTASYAAARSAWACGDGKGVAMQSCAAEVVSRGYGDFGSQAFQHLGSTLGQWENKLAV